ncbi:hypothetical protein BV25DRAFT_1919671 [Artomyces pyxidatus]|uniref:Uncharacterized protein n=1 Tax=Artomyces pyxidatus TaxID=48021 RepID=A0ACB8SP24_9AGAM|nr:hypothetical protein BV25DRAFT_1919671 [Artomyces pyxidatus]
MNLAPISRKKFLFAPASDHSTPEDLARCFAQQPLDGISNYLKPDRNSICLPPVLLWLDDQRRRTDGDYHADPIAALFKHIGLPDDGRIHYQRFVIDGDMNSSPGIAVGNNYQGIPMVCLPKMIEFFGKGQNGNYFLDRRKWKWVIEPFKRGEFPVKKPSN